MLKAGARQCSAVPRNIETSCNAVASILHQESYIASGSLIKLIDNISLEIEGHFQLESPIFLASISETLVELADGLWEALRYASILDVV